MINYIMIAVVAFFFVLFVGVLIWAAFEIDAAEAERFNGKMKVYDQMTRW